MDRKTLLSSIPKVDEILKIEEINDLMNIIPRTLVLDSVRSVLNIKREMILKTPEDKLGGMSIDTGNLVNDIMKDAVKRSGNHLKRVVNGTGVVIHTNLGRSILCREALDAVQDIAGNYSNLEYDLENGERGSRYSHVEDIILKITGAESAMVVNNNAAAVMLVLNTLCMDKEAIVSRGELVEIGGSFRVPEVMERSGAKLVEVGATNRTRISDYERAINENTGGLLKVHTSNYRILGFTEAPDRKELAALGNKNNIPVIEDIGSGSFIDFSKYGLTYEPTVQDSLKAGMDIVTFSGDKMLGGPQAGIIAGKRKYIDLMKKNPLTRALRVDKMTLAALEATLRQYIEEENAMKSIPTLSMIVEPIEKLRGKARNLARLLKTDISEKASIDIVKEFSEIGGGAMPLEYLPTYAVSVKPNAMSTPVLEERLRGSQVPIIARIWKDSVLFDMRTVDKEDFTLISSSLKAILEENNI